MRYMSVFLLSVEKMVQLTAPKRKLLLTACRTLSRNLIVIIKLYALDHIFPYRFKYLYTDIAEMPVNSLDAIACVS